MSDLALGGERMELSELLELAMETALHGMHISCPAVVVSYDRAAGTVEVSLPVDRLVPDSAGNLVAEPMPNLKDVPIGLPRCAAMGMTLPLAAGDSGQLIMCERSISAWRAGTGGHPGDTGTHTLDGAVFYPGLMPTSKPPKGSSAGNMTVGSETDAKGRVAYKPAGLELGAGATEAVLKGTSVASATSTLSSALQTLNAAINTYILAIKPIADPTNAATPALTAALTAASTAISNYDTAITNAKSASTTVL